MTLLEKFIYLWNTLSAWLLDIAFPDADEEELRSWLLARKGMRWHFPFSLPKAFSSDSSDEEIISLFPYRDPVMKKAIRKLKYRGNQKVAELCAESLLPLVSSLSREKQRRFGCASILIVPVPSSRRKLRLKGFNQSVLLAEALVRELEARQKDSSINGKMSFIYFHLRKDVLLKIKDTKAQVEVKEREKRLANLRDCFAVNPEVKAIIHKAVIFLVDDVTTTGSTFREASRVLLEAGATSVSCVSIAH